jgi:hypothetical protein
MHGAYVKTLEGNVKFAVQNYGNDVVFIPQCPDGIFEMVQVLNEFNQWSIWRSICRSVEKRCTYMTRTNDGRTGKHVSDFEERTFQTWRRKNR